MRKMDGKEYIQQQLGFYDITAEGLKRKRKEGKPMGKDLPTNNAISPYHESILANVKKETTVNEESAKKHRYIQMNIHHATSSHLSTHLYLATTFSVSSHKRLPVCSLLASLLGVVASKG